MIDENNLRVRTRIFNYYFYFAVGSKIGSSAELIAG